MVPDPDDIDDSDDGEGEQEIDSDEDSGTEDDSDEGTVDIVDAYQWERLMAISETENIHVIYFWCGKKYE